MQQSKGRKSHAENAPQFWVKCLIGLRWSQWSLLFFHVQPFFIFSLFLYFLYSTFPSQLAPTPSAFRHAQLLPVADGAHRGRGTFLIFPLLSPSTALSLPPLHVSHCTYSCTHGNLPSMPATPLKLLLSKPPITPWPSVFLLMNISSFHIISIKRFTTLLFIFFNLLCLFFLISFRRSSFCSSNCYYDFLFFPISTCFWLTLTLTQFQMSLIYDVDS